MGAQFVDEDNVLFAAFVLSKTWRIGSSLLVSKAKIYYYFMSELYDNVNLRKGYNMGFMKGYNI